MYRPASNWNGHRPERYPTGAQRELVRSLGPFRHPVEPRPAPRPFAPVVTGLRSMPLPSWLPDCDE